MRACGYVTHTCRHADRADTHADKPHRNTFAHRGSVQWAHAHATISGGVLWSQERHPTRTSEFAFHECLSNSGVHHSSKQSMAQTKACVASSFLITLYHSVVITPCIHLNRFNLFPAGRHPSMPPPLPSLPPPSFSPTSSSFSHQQVLSLLYSKRQLAQQAD